jgi:type I restriction enzyme S subunit
MMNPERLLEQFHRIAEAPEAVPRLRRFILDQAVRGNLLEQDPNDEPATALLKRIQAEKARLVKKAKAFRKVTDDEKPFNSPKGWEWVRIRQVTTDRGQTVPQTDFTYIDVTSIDKARGCIAEPKILSASEAPSRARKLVQKGDVIYSCVRPYLLNIAVVDNEIEPPPIASTAFAVMYGFGLVLPQYLWITLRSPFMVESVETSMRGQAYPAINDSDFAVLPVPLPPLAEQHRIVAKVDELMALCDQFEAAKAEREQGRDRLVATSLHRLNQSSDTAETDASDAFRDHALFVFNHLPRLTTRPEHIKQLRQTILNLAVRGKLVPQDPKDEPASELLKRIEVEKIQLVKQGTIKRQLPLVPVKVDEVFPAIPDSWKWMRLSDLLLGDSQNGYSKKPDDARNGIPILRISAGTARKDGIVAEDEHKLIGGISVSLQKQFQLEPGDLLACRFNGNRSFVGRLSLYTGYLGIKPIYPDKLIRLRLLSQFVLPKLVMYFAESNDVRKDIESYCATTVGNWGISASNLKEVKIPLPPLAEQHRIVAKVDELMTLCDQLDVQLTTTEADSRCLLDAVLHETLISRI